MSYEKISLDITDHIACLTLNDPSSLNAFGGQLRDEFWDALDTVENPDNGARCLLLTGAGRAFSSGANLSERGKPEGEGKPESQSVLEAWYNPALLRLRDLDMPFITAVNGVAAGVGMSFALSADLILAARSAYFLQAFTRIGLVPDGGSTFILPRLAGVRRAMELSLLAERLPAEKAMDWGLINRVCDDDALMDEAMALAARLANGPTVAYKLIRKAYWQSPHNSYEQQMQLEADYQKIAGASEDSSEGVAAFREKRAAAFKGR